MRVCCRLTASTFRFDTVLFNDAVCVPGGFHRLKNDITVTPECFEPNNGGATLRKQFLKCEDSEPEVRTDQSGAAESLPR